jgi:hypothetical protein
MQRVKETADPTTSDAFVIETAVKYSLPGAKVTFDDKSKTVVIEAPDEELVAMLLDTGLEGGPLGMDLG